MPGETYADVTEIQNVQDSEGSVRSPATNEAQGNWPGLDGFTHSTSGTDPEALPSNDVPNGVTVYVHPLATNADVVRIGPSGAVTYPMASADAGYTAQVSDTGQLNIETPNSGDGVAVHFEVEQ